MTEQRTIVPFLKWAGGKRWFVSKHSDILPAFTGTYIEPFLGSGSVFFHLCPSRAILGDCNSDLIETYKAIRDDWQTVIGKLRDYIASHSVLDYYRVRSQVPEDPSVCAARFIYLNRTCWNGLYRVNSKGQFNVPIGTPRDLVFSDDYFRDISEALQNASLNTCDFELLIKQAKSGDMIFADPPYTVRHNNNGFIKYNETLFSWSDQERLAKCLKNAAKRGAHVVLTNACHDSVRKLYDKAFDIVEVSRFSSISGKADSRGTYSELLITSRPRNRRHVPGHKELGRQSALPQSPSGKNSTESTPTLLVNNI